MIADGQHILQYMSMMMHWVRGKKYPCRHHKVTFTIPAKEQKAQIWKCLHDVVQIKLAQLPE